MSTFWAILSTLKIWIYWRTLQKFQDARRDRAEKIVARLNRLGVRITMAQVLYKAGDGAIGRPHVADVLLEEGFVFSHDHAFQKYLGYGKPAYQSKFVLTLREAVEVIHAAGGLASLAHPILYRRDALIPDLIKQGLDGIEVITCQTRPCGYTSLFRYGKTLWLAHNGRIRLPRRWARPSRDRYGPGSFDIFGCNERKIGAIGIHPLP